METVARSRLTATYSVGSPHYAGSTETLASYPDGQLYSYHQGGATFVERDFPIRLLAPLRAA